MRTRVAKLAFNRGLISRLGLARADIKRMAMAAQIQKNWMTRVLGSMMLRPGLGHLGSSHNDAQAFHLSFVFSVEDKASVEITDLALRAWVDDAVVTRAAVTSAITNGTFAVNLTGWTNADEAGATSVWQAGGYMGLTGNGTSFAIERQQVAVVAADSAVEHALQIVVERGPVLLRVGSTSGDDDLITEVSLGTGYHSLAFTPNGANFWVEFKSRLARLILVDSIAVEAAGAMVVTAPWAAADLSLLRYDQSGDVLFVACDSYQQYRIERHSTTGWSVVVYEPEDGPFRTANISTTTITPSALSGNISLTASKPLFRSGHVGALFQITSTGQTVTSSIVAQNTFTGSIRVTGVSTSRGFTILLTGLTASGSTVTLQRSFDEGTTWIDVVGYTTDQSITFNDGLDNQDILYRIGVKLGDYGAGTQVCTLAITTGSITGVARITAFTSNLVVSAEVLTAFGATTASDDWAEGQWSDYRGYPSAVGFHEGRLVWAGRDKVDASISDAFDAFDPDFEGDAGPISRSIGTGPVDIINWLLSLQRLILGGQGAEFSVRSSSLDEPLTPTNFNLKAASTQGSAPVAGVKIDQNGAYVQRGGVRVYELAFGSSGIDYESTHLSALIPEIGRPGIVKMVVQRQPDTRLHCIRSDGTVAILVFDKVEQVICWLEVETDGEVEDADVLPGDPGDAEDFVYYSVKRTINGATKRFREKWAFEEDCRGSTVSKLADSYVLYQGVHVDNLPAGSISHLNGEEVVVWADGVDVGTVETPNMLLPAGAIADYASSQNAVVDAHAGGLEIEAEIQPDDWTAGVGTNPHVINKFVSNVLISWSFGVMSTGELRLIWSPDGPTANTAMSTVAMSFADGTKGCIKAILRLDNGSGNSEVRFYTRVQASDPWVQLGAAVTFAVATQLFQSTAPIRIGSGATGFALQGRVFYACVRDGVDGTMISEFNPAAAKPGISAFRSDYDDQWVMEGDAVIVESYQRYTATAGGQLSSNLPQAAQNIVAGLSYEATFQSAKLAELMENPGGSLTDHQTIKSMGLILADVHAQGLKFGQSLDENEMNRLPMVEEGAVVDADTVHDELAGESIVFPGEWSTDARVCLLARAPRAVTVLAAITEVEHHG